MLKSWCLLEGQLPSWCAETFPLSAVNRRHCTEGTVESMAFGDRKKPVPAMPFPLDLSLSAPSIVPVLALWGKVPPVHICFPYHHYHYFFQKCNRSHISPHLDLISCISSVCQALSLAWGDPDRKPSESWLNGRWFSPWTIWFPALLLSSLYRAFLGEVVRMLHFLPEFWAFCRQSSLSFPFGRGAAVVSGDLWELTQSFRKPTESSRSV